MKHVWKTLRIARFKRTDAWKQRWTSPLGQPERIDTQVIYKRVDFQTMYGLRKQCEIELRVIVTVHQDKSWYAEITRSVDGCEDEAPWRIFDPLEEDLDDMIKVLLSPASIRHLKKRRDAQMAAFKKTGVWEKFR